MSVTMRLLAFMLLFGNAVTTQAGGDFCSDYPNGVVDGSLPATYPLPSAFGVDRDCTIINFPLGNPLAPNGWEPTLNFYTPDKNYVYLIVFDSVYFNGNMACSSIDHRLWAVNSSGFKASCQDIMIPAEMIDKQSPAVTASIGVPFTYTLTMPSMNYPAGDPSDNTLGNVIMTDDLTATGTLRVGPDGVPLSDGAELTYLSHTAYIKGGATLTEGSDYTFSNGGDDKHLTFDFGQIPAGTQIVVELTVVLDDVSPTNDAGQTFINTAKWTFSRSIDLDENGLIEDGTVDLDGDGIFENEFFDPLPGEPGVAALMTIAEPDLVVSKSSSTTAMNLGTTATYTVHVQNNGGTTAWEASLLDSFPAGMCDYAPTTAPGVTVDIYDAAGTTLLRDLQETTDYTLTWSGDPTCELSIQLLTTDAAIAPTEQLIITYPSQLDADVADGSTHTNIAVAQQWYNGDSSITSRKQYGPYTSTDGSETYADTETVTATLSGYFLKKIVTNGTTGETPALSASPGDTLHYTLLLENFNIPTLTGITITDDLGALNGLDYIVSGSLTNVVHTFPVAPTINSSGGTNGAGLITISGFDLGTNSSYQIEFDVTVGADAEGDFVQNQATITGYDTGSMVTLNGVSDDPYVSGPIKLGTGGDVTEVAVLSGGALLKQNDQSTATIGEQFTYTIKVPATPVNLPLYEVEITDDLTATGVDLKFIHAEVTAGSTWQGTVTNSGTGASDTNLVLKNDITGIDIPANGYAEIKVTVELLNTTNNNAGDLFHNQASYSYDRTNGGGLRVTPASAASDTTADMTIVEPVLTVSKAVTFASPAGKDALTDPATVGDVLQYVVTVDNNSADAIAYDVNVVDTLPPELAFYSGFTPTATINGAPVATFAATPLGAPDGPLIWGGGQGDGSLDIPASGQLVLTYQVSVEAVTGSDINNTVYVDWISWDGVSADGPRSGDGCPTITAPNDYCTGPAQATVATQDNTALSKLVSDDSYAESPPSAGNPVVRVGDTVTYDLVLNLQEYTTQSVTVTDQLPAGMELVSYSYDHGTITFNYTMVSEPTAPATGLLTWEFGDIENVPSGDATPVDPLVIRYVARVQHGVAEVPDPTPTTQTLTNGATLTYTGYDPANPALSANAPVDVLQPQITTITKSGTVVGPAATGSGTLADPYAVDIVNNSMDFQLQVCNDGDAPAYGVVITDQLAAELDETSITAPVVNIDANPALTDGVDYTYTAPAGRPGMMTFTLDNTPLAPTECVNISYNVGLYTDTAPNSTWNNSATVTEYWSRETLDPANAREYIGIPLPVPASSIYMTNSFTPVAPTKTVASPLTGEVTIGDAVSYTITVPGTPVNAELSDVVVSDTLDAALIYDSANVEVNGVPTAIVPVVSGQDLGWTLPTIPAGQQAVITLNAHVANTVDTDAGNTFANVASYTYDVGGVPTPGGSSDPLTATLLIIEPTVTMGKSVANQSNPGNAPVAGDVLRYTLQLDASGGANFSDAFDVSIIDDLSLGLAYQAGSATLDAAPLADPVNVTAGDGITTAQQLRWSLADGNDIDIPEGSSVTITYDVVVQSSVVAGQDLINSAVAQWTGLDGVNANERDGSDGFGVEPNDYETAAQSTTLTVADNTAFTKSVVADSDAATAVGTLRIGDTVDYRLDITLQEGTTNGISIADTLDPGLEFDSIVSIDGDTVADYDPVSANFSYSTISAGSLPSAGATGTLTFPIGDVVNTPDGNAANDVLTIIYRARVAPGVLAQAPTTTLNNSALLSYNTSSTLSASASVSVLQPVMSAVTKLGNGATNTSASALAVNVASDTVQFTIESCNTTGLAPAYNVQLTDVLASQLDEGSLVGPAVTINGAAATDGVHYNYTPPAGRGGSLIIDLIDPVNPGQCVTAVYDIGFYTDFGPNQTWSNSVTLDEYWSLNGNSGEQYAGSGPATFWMTNQVAVTPLSKAVVSPASEITIGEVVTYQIVVPAIPINAALDNVVVSDTLHGALTYLGATAVDNGGAPVALVDTTSGQDVTLGIAQIPAGEQVTITLTARVANNAQANGGVSFDNTAAYTYTGMSDPTQTQATSGALTIVEPELAINKIVTNTTNPGLPPVTGDILQYSVTFTASGGAAGDNFSNAFDLQIDDTLSLGLLYLSGTATVDGTGNTIADPATNGGDGITTAQVLTWSLGDASADIDVVEGSIVTVTYGVEVLPSVQAGQDLTNSATVQWTGIDDANAFERNGTATPAENDYYTGPATTTLTTQFAVTFTKSVVNLTTSQTPGDNASPGDTLQYTLVIANQSVATLTNGAVVDELAAEFEPNTLSVSISGGLAYTDNSSGSGGANGSGIIDISGISLAPQGSAGDTLTIVFEATLASVIQSGTTVLNQGQLSADALPATLSNTTSTLIGSAPLFEVWKSSQDLNGGTLVPGDTLRYTVTVQNIGTESAVNTTLRDLVPVNTTYVANSTTLNGASVSDVSGTTALQDGMLINAPEDSTPGAMRADASGTTTNVATITFDVVINDVFDGTVISNQAYVTADGAGTSGPVPEVPSDDPSTVTLNDPTLDVVGNVPSVDAQKVVSISLDGGLPGVAEAGDRLLYTITITNNGTTPATNVVFTDAIPANTTYVAGSVTLNSIAVADVAGVSPLVGGMPVSSSDLTPPLPTVGNGTISPGQTATVTFEVTINAVASGTVISNQGSVSLDQQVDEPTDFDGIDSNGDQPTTIVVDAAQQLAITKEAFIVGGGAALPGSTVEYLIRITNTSITPATNVVITDNLDLPVAGQLIYVAGSATMNGSSNGVDESALPLLTADYAGTYGDLAPGAVVTLRFRAQLDAALTDGTEVLNTADVVWDAPAQTASATARLVVGGYYGTATLKGQLWHDANFNNVFDGGELPLANWNVDLYRNGSFVGTTLSGAGGNYTLTNIQPNDTSGDLLELRFRAPAATATTAALGLADSPFTDGLQRISGITVAIGDSIPNLNLPLDPSGVVYESIARTPVAGATLTMLQSGSGTPVDASCFDDPVQQGQVTLANGYYKFDLNFTHGSCPQGGDYVISVTPPASGFDTVPSRIIPPATDASTAAYSVPLCSSDAVAAPAGYCEAQPSEFAPSTAVVPRTAGTTYYLHLTLDDPQPENSQLFNNHIPLDPELNEAVAITKRSGRVNVSRGEMVPYTITVNNSYLAALQGLSIIDTFPAGFKYVEGSSRYDGTPLEPTIIGNQLRWENIDLGSGDQHTIQLVFVVGSGVSEGEFINRAQVINAFTSGAVSGEATATVRVVPDPTFDCTDIIGKVFDDRNLNGYQDEGEAGLPGVRVVTARGLIVTSDEYGRFHITCAMVPNESRGSNFILKLDDRSLPSGYRVTSENPRVQRLTRGKMAKFNFGATIHRVVRLDVADGVFEPGTTTMRPQWRPRIGLLLEELKKSPAQLRISYLADVEREGLVAARVELLKEMISEQWQDLECCYKLTIESEVYWRRGAPPVRSGVID